MTGSFKGALEGVAKSINSQGVQQFLANQISTLTICTELRLPLEDFVLHHAFPRSGAIAAMEPDEGHHPDAVLASVTRLTSAHLFDAAKAYADSMGVGEERVMERVAKNGAEYAEAFEAIETRKVPPSSIDLSRRIDDVQRRLPSFNTRSTITRREALERLAAEDGMAVVEQPALGLLSLCAMMRGTNGEWKRYFFIKSGIHPALRDFLVAHELAHSWLHMDRDALGGRLSFESFYLRSAHGWSHLENEADSVALIALFPTPYLAACEVRDELSVRGVLLQFLAQYDVKPGAALQKRLGAYIEKRLASYDLFRNTIEVRQNGVYLGRTTLTAPQAEAFEHLLHSLGAPAWFRADANGCIVDCSDAFAEKVGMSRSAAMAMSDMDLVAGEARALWRDARRHEQTKHRTSFTFPTYTMMNGNRVTVGEQSIPISAGNNYLGRIALLYEPTSAIAAENRLETDWDTVVTFPSHHLLHEDMKRIFERGAADDPPENAFLEKRFSELLQAWEAERDKLGPVAFTTEICTLPSYQRIIGLGPAAVPLILRELEKKRDKWFWALNSIVGRSPVRAEDRGNVEAMTTAWLAWGREYGYL